MSYKYINAGQAIQVSPKNDYIQLFQQNLTEQFYNSSDWFTISEETALGSGIYQNVDVRINKVIDAKTGDRVGDDFKLLMFSDLTHPTDLGKMYMFDDNYWITVNINKIKSLATTVTIRRCNNTLRWMDLNGAIYKVPCVINYLIKENRDYSTAGSSLVIPSGMIEILVQKNTASNKIKANQRFLFGNSDNWTAYRIEGGGIANFNNLKTLDNSSVGLSRLSLSVDFVNTQTDDIVNGIADVVENVYVLSLNQSSISGDISQTVQLQTVITLNGDTVSRTLVWSSNNPTIATVNSSGLVTFVALGNAVITCSLLDNSSVFDTCSVSVGSTPVDNYQIIISPNRNYIIEEDEQTWTVYLYKNGVAQIDTFSFTLDANTVPSNHYIYTVIGGNSFKIHNYQMFLTDTLDVTMTTGSYTDVISISLRGAW